MKNNMFLLLLLGLLSACHSRPESKTIRPIPLEKQQEILRRTRPPQQFRFTIFPQGDGIGIDGGSRLHPNHVSTAEMLTKGIPIIKTTGMSERNTLKTLLDYSNDASWIDFAASQKMGVLFLGINDMTIPYRGVCNTGGYDAYAAILTQLRIGNVFIEDIPFFVRMATGPLGPLARGIEKPQAQAVLGYDTLKNFEYVRIDLRKGTLFFSATTPYSPRKDLLLATTRIVPTAGYGLTVEGAIDGKKVPILLDFAGQFHFARSDAKMSTTGEVKLGDILCTQVPTLVLEPHTAPSRAGRYMLENYVVTICAPNGLVYFERPETKD